MSRGERFESELTKIEATVRSDTLGRVVVAGLSGVAGYLLGRARVGADEDCEPPKNISGGLYDDRYFSTTPGGRLRLALCNEPGNEALASELDTSMVSMKSENFLLVLEQIEKIKGSKSQDFFFLPSAFGFCAVDNESWGEMIAKWLFPLVILGNLDDGKDEVSEKNMYDRFDNLLNNPSAFLSFLEFLSEIESGTYTVIPELCKGYKELTESFRRVESKVGAAFKDSNMFTVFMDMVLNKGAREELIRELVELTYLLRKFFSPITGYTADFLRSTVNTALVSSDARLSGNKSYLDITGFPQSLQDLAPKVAKYYRRVRKLSPLGCAYVKLRELESYFASDVLGSRTSKLASNFFFLHSSKRRKSLGGLRCARGALRVTLFSSVAGEGSLGLFSKYSKQDTRSLDVLESACGVVTVAFGKVRVTEGRGGSAQTNCARFAAAKLATCDVKNSHFGSFFTNVDTRARLAEHIDRGWPSAESVDWATAFSPSDFENRTGWNSLNDDFVLKFPLKSETVELDQLDSIASLMPDGSYSKYFENDLPEGVDEMLSLREWVFIDGNFLRECLPITTVYVPEGAILDLGAIQEAGYILIEPAAFESEGEFVSAGFIRSEREKLQSEFFLQLHSGGATLEVATMLKACRAMPGALTYVDPISRVTETGVDVVGQFHETLRLVSGGVKYDTSYPDGGVPLVDPSVKTLLQTEFFNEAWWHTTSKTKFSSPLIFSAQEIGDLSSHYLAPFFQSPFGRDLQALASLAPGSPEVQVSKVSLAVAKLRATQPALVSLFRRLCLLKFHAQNWLPSTKSGLLKELKRGRGSLRIWVYYLISLYCLAECSSRFHGQRAVKQRIFELVFAHLVLDSRRRSIIRKIFLPLTSFDFKSCSPETQVALLISAVESGLVDLGIDDLVYLYEPL